MHTKGTSDAQAQDADEELGAVASGGLCTLTFLLVAYVPATFIGELFGNRGLPASPWLLAPIVGCAVSVMMWVEPWLQSRSWWSWAGNVWGALLMGLSVVAPVVVAVVRPMSLWPWLPPVVPTVLSLAPIALALWCVKRWHRHLRKHQRPQLGPFRPVPRIGEADCHDA
ncbi:hypothetical protein [Streptomyces sp. NPDC059063]|uniref:hypothetical protein n=1 Tax=unclassified Streptomyces TaxID=2593676 RepID=UPI0036C5C58B